MGEQVSRGERFSARRGGLCVLLTGMAAVMTLRFIVQMEQGVPHRPVVIGWLAWQVIPLVLAFVGPGVARRLRFSRFTDADLAVIHDELTRANRRAAAQAGFVVVLAGAVAGALGAVGWLALPGWWPVALVSAGVSAAGLAFAVLDIRAQRQ